MPAKPSKIEIMSPAGSYEALMSAIKAGAGSVYFGIGEMNMRSRSAANFSLNDLNEISGICHDNQVKSYLTINTVVYDNEVGRMKELIDAAKENGISAIIASDQAVIDYAFKNNVEVHLSTQLSISNFDALKFYASFADVVVLARELTLPQIKYIHDKIIEENVCGPSGNLIRLEVFVHGALCMAISGKCFMSLDLHNTSANRGACYQVCRREFTVFDDRGLELKLDNHYLMSPKDLCTISILDRIIDAGASVLKIEGRGRSPEYVFITTKVYHDAVRSIEDRTYSAEKIIEWNKQLERVYNRGFWTGHYLGEYTADWNTDAYGSIATLKKEYVARGIKYFSRIRVGEFLLESGSIKAGDTAMLIGPTTGTYEFEVKEIRINDQAVETVPRGEVFSIPVNVTVRPSDKLYVVKKK